MQSVAQSLPLLVVSLPFTASHCPGIRRRAAQNVGIIDKFNQPPYGALTSLQVTMRRLKYEPSSYTTALTTSSDCDVTSFAGPARRERQRRSR